MRNWIDLIEQTEAGTCPRPLYHGTCPDNAESLVEHGCSPGSGVRGANMGQVRYLYLSTGFEDAMWFAEQKGCGTVVEVRDVPMGHLIVDPEDSASDTVPEELNLRSGLPGKLALVRTLGPAHFRVREDAPG